MNDREKVIKGLECCNSASCQKCPYNENKECNNRGFFYSQAIEDALALLKKQWRPTGHWIVKKDKNEECYGVCSECGKEQQVGMLNYCPYCGAEMENRRNNHDR